MRIVWLGLGATSLLLGLIGIVLPLLPTVPFLLAATFCFSKSAPSLHLWITQHRVLGPPIAKWRKTGAISIEAKRWATVSIAGAFGVGLFWGLAWKVIAVQVVVLMAVMLFIWSRPSE